MHRNSLWIFFGWFLALSSGIGSACAATPDFTISATNVTMPISGNGSLPFTLTSVNGYTGLVTVNCLGPNASAGTRVPYCIGGAPTAEEYTLTANEVIKESFILAETPIPAASLLHPTGDVEAATLALAGALLFGLSARRRRSARRLTLALFTVVTLASLSAIGGCGGGRPGLTPGIYAYTITATEPSTGATMSTTANVTVP